jgi:hypothetical protein
MKGVEDFYPLSPAQKGILFDALYSPNTRVYFQQVRYRINGPLNVPAFVRAWEKVIERHPSLRTAFFWEGFREPIQAVSRQVTLPLEQRDWRGLSAAEQQTFLEEVLSADRAQGFDLLRAPLMRFALLRLADETHSFIWSCHHILLDGWSMYVISQEVGALYHAFNEGRGLELGPPPSYRDYILWLSRQNPTTAEAFWRQSLKGFSGGVSLVTPPWSTSVPDQEEGYSEQQMPLSIATTRALNSLGRQHRLTMNTLVQGAWALLLSYYSGQRDIVFGVVVSGRPPELAHVEAIVGLFVNTLPMRARVTPGEILRDWLKGLQERQMEMQSYEYSPLFDIQQWSEVARGESLFDSIFAFENFPTAFSRNDEKGEMGLDITVEASFERTSYPITVMASPGPPLTIRILYDSRRVDTSAVERMLARLQSLLENMVSNIEQPISVLNAVMEVESEELIEDFNANLEVY